MAGPWYVKKAGTPRGPFPTGALLQDRLLGRIPDDALLSVDREDWRPFVDWPELTTAELEAETPPSNAENPSQWLDERAKARLRWADERSNEERRVEEPSARGKGDDRRRHAHPGNKHEKHAKRRSSARQLLDTKLSLRLVLIVLIVAAALLALAFWYGPVNPVPVNLR